MKVFIKKIAFRLLLLMASIYLLSFMKRSEYLWNISEGTDFNKIPWVSRILKSNEIDSNTVVFLGPSLCENGINDSLMSAFDSTGTTYYNLGVNHSCHIFTYEILKNILKRSKPKKIILWQKLHKAINIHDMYPLVAEVPQLQKNALSFNIHFHKSLIRRAAWNFSYFFPFNKLEINEKKIKKSNWGYTPGNGVEASGTQIPFAEGEVDKHIFGYTNIGQLYTKDLSKNNAFMYNNKYIWRWYLNNIYWPYILNQKTQEAYFLKCIELCEREHVEYSVLYYPNYSEACDRQYDEIMNNIQHYYNTLYHSNINWIFIDQRSLNNIGYYYDNFHLNKIGASVFSVEVMKNLSE